MRNRPRSEMTPFEQRIRALAERERLSATALGEAVGMSHAAVRNWIANSTDGPPGRVSEMVTFARYYGVSLDWLLNDEPLPKGYEMPPRGTPLSEPALTRENVWGLGAAALMLESPELASDTAVALREVTLGGTTAPSTIDEAARGLRRRVLAMRGDAAYRSEPPVNIQTEDSLDGPARNDRAKVADEREGKRVADVGARAGSNADKSKPKRTNRIDAAKNDATPLFDSRKKPRRCAT